MHANDWHSLTPQIKPRTASPRSGGMSGDSPLVGEGESVFLMGKGRDRGFGSLAPRRALFSARSISTRSGAASGGNRERADFDRRDRGLRNEPPCCFSADRAKRF